MVAFVSCDFEYLLLWTWKEAIIIQQRLVVDKKLLKKCTKDFCFCLFLEWGWWKKYTFTQIPLNSWKPAAETKVTGSKTTPALEMDFKMHLITNYRVNSVNEHNI